MTSDESNIEERLENAYRSLDRVIAWVSNADTKALVFLTFQGVIVGLLGTSIGSMTAAITRHRGATIQFALLALLATFTLTFLASIFVFLAVLFPDTKEREHDAGKGSLLFFGTIKRMGLTAFVEKSILLTPATIEQELLRQVFVNSDIVARKFHRLKFAVIFLLSSLVAFLAALACIVMSAQFPQLG